MSPSELSNEIRPGNVTRCVTCPVVTLASMPVDAPEKP